MKTCKKCEVTSLVSSFGKDASRSDGLRIYCRACESAKNKARYNPAKTSNAYYANPAKYIARTIEWQRKNRERNLENKRAWSRANPEAQKRWVQENKEKVLLSSRTANAKARVFMSDGYIRSLLCEDEKLTPDQIPQALCDVKREQLRIVREIKKGIHDECK